MSWNVFNSREKLLLFTLFKRFYSASSLAPKKRRQVLPLSRPFHPSSNWKLDHRFTSSWNLTQKPPEKARDGYFGLPISTPSDLLSLAANAISLSQASIEKLIGEWRSKDPKFTLKMALHAIDDVSNLLCAVADPSELLRHVHGEAEWRDAANSSVERIAEFIAQVNINTEIYRLLNESSHDCGLDAEEQLVLRHMRESMECQGVHLTDTSRAEYLEALKKELSLSFSVMESGELRHSMLPPEWRIPPNPQLYQQLLKNSENAELRRLIWSSQRISDKECLGKMLELRDVRTRLSRLRGFNNYLEYSQKECMLGHEEVGGFLIECCRLLEEPLKRDLEELAQLKMNGSGGSTTDRNSAKLFGWDLDYLINLKRNENRLFLSLKTVLTFFTRLVQKLFDVHLEEDPSPEKLWDPHVVRFNLRKNGRVIAHLYLDLFERDNKSNICAQFTIRCSKSISPTTTTSTNNSASTTSSGGVFELLNWGNYYEAGGALKQIPSTVVVASFPLPTTTSTTTTTSSCTTTCTSSSSSSDQLLVKSRVDLGNCEILFHELGHTLHTLLSDTRLQHLSGNRGPIDFAEFSSHLFEQFFHHNLGELMEIEGIGGLFAEDQIYNYKRFESVDLARMVVSSQIDQKFYDDAFEGDWGRMEREGDYYKLFQGFNLLLSPFSSTNTTNNTSTSSTTTNSTTTVGGKELMVNLLGPTAISNFDHLVHYGGNYYCYLYSRMLAIKVYRSFETLTLEQVGERLLEFFSQGSVESSIGPIARLAGGKLGEIKDSLF